MKRKGIIGIFLLVVFIFLLSVYFFLKKSNVPEGYTIGNSPTKIVDASGSAF